MQFVVGNSIAVLQQTILIITKATEIAAMPNGR